MFGKVKDSIGFDELPIIIVLTFVIDFDLLLVFISGVMNMGLRRPN